MVRTTSQYYQYLYALTSGEATQTDKGSFTSGVAAWQLKAACREETAGRSTKVVTTDGISRDFKSLIQLPVGTQRLDEGTEIIVTSEEVNVTDLLDQDFIATAKSSGIIVAKGPCLKFDYGRLHCRIWI